MSVSATSAPPMKEQSGDKADESSYIATPYGSGRVAATFDDYGEASSPNAEARLPRYRWLTSALRPLLQIRSP